MPQVRISAQYLANNHPSPALPTCPILVGFKIRHGQGICVFYNCMLRYPPLMSSVSGLKTQKLSDHTGSQIFDIKTEKRDYDKNFTL